ncbi:MAG: hypothetical protein QGI09_10305 [Dehalococcoidia bacterium]|nr:hypothetical protein [Dehalococcoidia bacterium]
MSEAKLALHERALVIKNRCPACAELLDYRAIFLGESCKACGTTLSQKKLTTSHFVRGIEKRGKRQLVFIAALIAVGNLVVGWIPLLSSILALCAAVWIRLGILYPMTAFLSPKRRFLTRFTARVLVALFLALTLILSEALTLMPCIGLFGKSLIGTFQVFFMAAIVTSYVTWQVRRASDGAEPAKWEWAFLATIVSSVLGAFFVLVRIMLWVFHALDYLIGGS